MKTEDKKVVLELTPFQTTMIASILAKTATEEPKEVYKQLSEIVLEACCTLSLNELEACKAELEVNKLLWKL